MQEGVSKENLEFAKLLDRVRKVKSPKEAREIIGKLKSHRARLQEQARKYRIKMKYPSITEALRMLRKVVPGGVNIRR